MRYKESKAILRSYYRYYYLVTNNAADILIDFEKQILKDKTQNLSNKEKIKVLDELPNYIETQSLLQELSDNSFEKQLKL